MMQWERPYMEACIDALSPCGDVLEIGFGCGYSATRIQEYGPKSHTIIEYHPMVAERAREWAKGRDGVRIVEGTWQEKLGELGKFDEVFFDDYPLESGDEMKKLETSKKTSEEIVSGQKKLFEQVFASVPELATMKYGDGDLEMFFLVQRPNEIEARYFLDHLLKHENITRDQYQKYEALHCPQKPEPVRENTDRLFTFINLCIESHLNPGARISCFLENPTAPPNLNHPLLTYSETTIPIDVPPHCAYYNFDHALIPLFTYTSDKGA